MESLHHHIQSCVNSAQAILKINISKSKEYRPIPLKHSKRAVTMAFVSNNASGKNLDLVPIQNNTSMTNLQNQPTYYLDFNSSSGHG